MVVSQLRECFRFRLCVIYPFMYLGLVVFDSLSCFSLACRAMALNRLADLSTDPITPVPLPTILLAVGAPQAVAAPRFPLHFPATKGDLLHLNVASANAFLMAYGLPAPAARPLIWKINQLANKLSMKIPIT